MIEDAQERFRELHDAVDFDLSFAWDMVHYLQEPSTDERNLARIKPKDPGLFRVLRYKLDLTIDRFPLVVEARPLTPDAPMQAVEDGRRAVESVVFDPRRAWNRAERRLLGGALGARAWGFRLGYNQRSGMTFDSEHPANILWAEGYMDLHHPDCPWAIRLCRMTRKHAAAVFGKPESSIKPDGGTKRESSTYEGSSAYPASPAMKKGLGEFVTVAYVYSRFEMKAPRKPKGMMALEPGMYHMACAECGWTSPPQAEAMQEYPEADFCPDCGAEARRIESVPPKSPENAYTNGKRLVICAPFSQGDDEEPWRDGSWEFDYDYFPIDLLIAYPPPHKPWGQSDASVLKTPLLAKNALIRLTYETLIRSKPYWVMPPAGAVTNVYGQPFAFQPNDGDIMFYGGPPSDLEIKQGQGVNQSVFSMMDRLDGVFRTNESTSEVAMSPSQLAETKVGTIDQYTESGNVVVDDHGRLLNELRSRQLTNVACALREMPSRQVRYRANDGTWQFAPMGGPTMPPFEIAVAAGHTLRDMDADEIQTFQTLVGMDPITRMAYAKVAHLDPSVLMSLPFNPMAAGAAPIGPPQPGVPAPEGVLNG